MQISKFIKKKGIEIDTVVHVGAHKGQELPYYLELSPVQILWIEADPDLFHVLEQALLQKVNDVNCKMYWINALVGDIDGKTTPFYRYSNSGQSSSIYRSTEKLRERWKKINLMETGEVLEMRMRRLDSIFQSINVHIKDMSVLVLDIQGAELLALTGLGRYIEKFEFIEVEVSQESIYMGAALFSEVDRFLTRHNFEKLSSVPWHGDVIYSRCGCR